MVNFRYKICVDWTLSLLSLFEGQTVENVPRNNDTQQKIMCILSWL